MLALLLVAQLAAATPADTIHVVGDARRAAVAVVDRGGVPMVRADQVVAPLGGSVRLGDDGHWLVSVHGAELDVVDGVPFARAGRELVPLSGSPRSEGTVLLVPLQLVTDVLPRFGSGVIFDPARGELRVFSTVVRHPGGGGSSAGSPSRTARSPRRESEPAPVVAARVGERAPRPRRRRLVVVDAGHGGPDNGMHGPIGGGPQIFEKHITLAVARLLSRELEGLGFDVAMTRTTDTLIALGDRGRIANQLKGDLFVSVHVNAANPTWKDPGAARGYETYLLSEAKTEDESRVERMENEAVRFETGANAPKGDPLSFIINDMAQNEHLRESSDLATTIQQSLGTVEPGPSRGVKQANFAVLRTSFMPAVLVEIGFGTNPVEADFLSSADGQRRIARSIAEGIAQYVSHYERRVGTAP